MSFSASLQAQLNVPNPPTQYSDYYRAPREMTSEDVGLRPWDLGLRPWNPHSVRAWVAGEWVIWPREMTADDLGLPLSQWTSRWLTAMYGAPLDFKPPYHFWLGAEAA